MKGADADRRGVEDSMENIVEKTDLHSSDFMNVAVLGRGSCGVVYKSWHWTSKTFVALKAISVLEEEKRRQVMKELRSFYNFNNAPGIVNFHGAFYQEGEVCMSLEYMDKG